MRLIPVLAGAVVVGALTWAGVAIADSSSSCGPADANGVVTCTMTDQYTQSPGPTTTVTEAGATSTVTQTDTTTETATVTSTVTQTDTATVTVPGPTTTVTVTTTPPPPPTTTPPPPPAPFAPGESLNATNTGYAAAGSSCPTGLTPSGAVTYSASGTAANPIIVSCVAYVGEVDIEGSYVTIQNCTLTNGGLNSIGFLLNGNHDTVRNCTITSPAHQSMYEPIWIFKDGNTVDGVNVSRGENALTTYGTHVTIENSWLHDAAIDSQPSDHPDAIEVYGGGTVSILNNKIVEACGPCPYNGQPGMFDSPINVAPYSTYKVQGLTIKGNFLDNGQGDTLIDNQNPSCAGATGTCLINVVVEGNAFGGHQCPASNPDCIGIFTDLENYEHRPDLQTAAAQAANPNGLLWPTSGPDVNRWEENDGTGIETSQTPKDGDVVIPSLT